jgi:beta-galactosidase
MTVGVYYYPEHWPLEQWDRDFAKMKEMGFEFVPIGRRLGLHGT